LFKARKASDSEELLIFIIGQIHKELKMTINFQSQSAVQPLDQYNRKNAFSYFMNNDFNKECSIISDIFFGITETTNVCLHCKKVYISQKKNYPICYNYEILNYLIFPLEDIKNFKDESCANFNIQVNQNNNITLYDCFSYNQKTRIFTGRNRYYCNICKQKFDSEFTSKLYSSPNVLIIILTRGNDNEYNIKLNFTETLNLTQFVELKDSPQMIYNLYGVITHVEQSGSKAHFIGFCKSPINNNWYKYNDAIINRVEDVQKEIMNFGNPIILLYQKEK
jgi:ubiquitin C-terminal hydrolase